MIADAPEYKVSDRGRVMGKRFGRPLKPGYCRGYARYILCVDGRHINRTAHSLVCEAFNGPRPSPGMHCAHRDGDKSNNTPENLYWATPKENSDDRERHGRTFRGPLPAEVIARRSGDNHWARRFPDRVSRGASHWKTGTRGKGACGERTGAAKLTEEAVLAILAEPRVHGSGRLLANRYGVSMALITAIRKGRAWAYLKTRPDIDRPQLPGGE